MLVNNLQRRCARNKKQTTHLYPHSPIDSLFKGNDDKAITRENECLWQDILLDVPRLLVFYQLDYNFLSKCFVIQFFGQVVKCILGIRLSIQSHEMRGKDYANYVAHFDFNTR